MAKINGDQFVELVKRSGLVDDERLNQALSGIDGSVSDSGIIASAFTKAGLLTEWQSEKLLQGKHKGFYLGKYKLLNHIGTGGMGSVYLAEHMVMRHRVAIKLLPNHLAAHTSYLERFHQEARASAQLYHRNMVRAFDVDNEGNIHYLVMEYVEGADLQAIVSRSGPLDYQTASNYIRQAAEGLAYAHRSGLIHRDIKPANLLVDKTGTVKILDMGLARFSDESQGSLTMTYDQKMIGTVDYLAPEQALDSHRVDARADIYSLGCTLYFMLSGDAPFPQGTIPQRLMAHQREEPADIRKSRTDVPDELLAICAKMMAKSADDRYQSADEIVEAMNQFIGDGGDENAPPKPKPQYTPPAGPSLNENLDLAPLDDEPRARGGDSKAAAKSGAASGSGVGSKSGIGSKSGAKQGPSSTIISGSGDTLGGGASGSGVGAPGKSGVRPGGRSGPMRTPVKPPELESHDDLVDDLLAAPPPSNQSLPQLPVASARKKSGDESGFHIGVVVGIGLLGAAAIGGVFYFLLWALDSMKM